MTTPSGHTEVIRAKKVIGTSVKNSAGQKIGQIEDIVLDKTFEQHRLRRRRLRRISRREREVPPRAVVGARLRRE